MNGSIVLVLRSETWVVMEVGNLQEIQPIYIVSAIRAIRILISRITEAKKAVQIIRNFW